MAAPDRVEPVMPQNGWDGPDRSVPHSMYLQAQWYRVMSPPYGLVLIRGDVAHTSRGVMRVADLPHPNPHILTAD